MKDVEFVALVAEMRAAQRDYFMSRTRKMMNVAMELEKRVDEEIKARKCGVQLRQKSLF